MEKKITNYCSILGLYWDDGKENLGNIPGILGLGYISFSAQENFREASLDVAPLISDAKVAQGWCFAGLGFRGLRVQDSGV